MMHCKPARKIDRKFLGWHLPKHLHTFRTRMKPSPAEAWTIISSCIIRKRLGQYDKARVRARNMQNWKEKKNNRRKNVEGKIIICQKNYITLIYGCARTQMVACARARFFFAQRFSFHNFAVTFLLSSLFVAFTLWHSMGGILFAHVFRCVTCFLCWNE